MMLPQSDLIFTRRKAKGGVVGMSSIVGFLNVISRFLSLSGWRKTSSLAENTMFVVVVDLLEPEAAYHPGSLYRMGLLF